MAVKFPERDAQFEGATFGTWEQNGYHDSDFLALVWDGEGLRGIEYNTTRFAGGGSATEDATDEAKLAAARWLYERDVAAWDYAAAHDALMAEKGRTAEVFKGRKVPVGTIGTIIWVGPDRFDRTGKRYRVGIKDADGEVHFTAESNVRVTDAAERITSRDEIHQSTARRLDGLVRKGSGHEWVSAYRGYGGAFGRNFTVGRDVVNGLLTELGRGEAGVAYEAALAAGRTEPDGETEEKTSALMTLARAIEEGSS